MTFQWSSRSEVKFATTLFALWAAALRESNLIAIREPSGAASWVS